MTDNCSFSPSDDDLSPTPNLHITIEECSRNSENLLEEDCNDIEIEGDDLENDCEQMLELECSDHENDRDVKLLELEEDNVHENERDDMSMADGHYGASEGKDYPQPVVGMEFNSYDDAYNYYNCYAKELGFAIRVKSSWTKRNSKEKRGAVLCCNCEGFKSIKEANSRRRETRTGCLAMIRLRLVESDRWRVDEVKLEHNHSFDPTRAQNSKSHKKMEAGGKRKVEPTLDVEVRTIKLYRTPVAEPVGYGSSNSNEGEVSNHVDRCKRLNLKKGDAQVIYNYFSRAQLKNPNFFYLMDLNDEGYLRNLFWIDSKSRAAYGYFGDVVVFDTTCLTDKYEIPLFTFIGVNHHGQPLLLGCGFIVDETVETYIWLFRAWLTCMSGRPPQTIITNQCKAMQSAISEVFPRAHHRLNLSRVMQSVFENLGEFQGFEVFETSLNKAVYDSLKVDEFEMAWEDMIQRFGLRDHDWLRFLYEDRERWVPAYLKDTFFAGMFTFQKGESTIPFFDGYVHQETSLNDFFEIYELVLQRNHQREVMDDSESQDSTPMLKTRHYYESQLSKLYTREIFMKFQDEVLMMSSCFSITQVHANGPLTTYIVKERVGEGNPARSLEVMYDKAGCEVRCLCSCFNFHGYLCRHSMCILNYNGTEEIPFHYILPRWRMDFKRMYIPDLGANNVDVTNPVQWFDHLYRRALQVVEEGMTSQDHYMVAWQVFKESLNKVRLVADKHV